MTLPDARGRDVEQMQCKSALLPALRMQSTLLKHNRTDAELHSIHTDTLAP